MVACICTRTIGRVLLVLLSIGANSSFAQSSTCTSTGDTEICQGPEGWSMMITVGDLVFVSRSDGSTATMQRVDDITLIVDSRQGMSGAAQQIGETTVYSLPEGGKSCKKMKLTSICS
ncbi:hypothetical protein LNV08_09235 [Paucibacter sp. TC2R-5]|uniref:hypothetical protein n=1 Tax=Paucibacter sp. TC2R-5 TaxID=2893555 RepID=UPI0021E479EF|nr:hypothetical protein [Paucibacter sp. TC2R-5]MCV2359159.1 hypothetical protein [Paucibacter sp. TC2R-5]